MIILFPIIPNRKGDLWFLCISVLVTGILEIVLNFTNISITNQPINQSP